MNAETDLLEMAPVWVDLGWLDCRRVRVICDGCGEGNNYEREVRVEDGRSAGPRRRGLLRGAAGDSRPACP